MKEVETFKVSHMAKKYTTNLVIVELEEPVIVPIVKPTNKFNHKVLELLLDDNTTTLTLLICLGFGMDKVFKMPDILDLYNNNTVKHVYGSANYFKGSETTQKYILISDRQLSEDFTKQKILKELKRLEDLGYLYLDDKKRKYCTDLFVAAINFAFIYEKCWFLFMNGSSMTKNMIKFVLQQMIDSQKQDVRISQSLLLSWLKDNTKIKSIKGKEYSKTLQLFKDENFLEFICGDNYLVNTDYACVGGLREKYHFNSLQVDQLKELGKVGDNKAGVLVA